MEKVIGKFEVKYLQVLDEQGNCDERLMPKVSSADIKKMYELMMLTRIFDNKAVKLQRQGRLGTYASVKGQEACQVGSAIQLEKGDFAVPAFREHGLFLTLGVEPAQILQYWGGDERGSRFPEGINLLPVSIPVGSHPLHAVGIGLGFKLQKKKNIGVSYFGDGATSEGEFHEAMNMAGVLKSQTIFICQNNQFAISVPVREQTAAQTIAQKAIAYGFEGIRVDGNDVFAVYRAMAIAIKKARNGEPTLIECFTYRMGDHTTSDDATRYRTEKEVKEWEKKDPIARLKKYMIKKKIMTEKYEVELQKKFEKTVDDAVMKYEKILPQPVEDLFKYTYKDMTVELKEQLTQLKEEMKK